MTPAILAPADAAFAPRHRQCHPAFGDELASACVPVVGQVQVLHDTTL